MARQSRRPTLFVQVNTGEEPQKVRHCCQVSWTVSWRCAATSSGCRCPGLMAIPPEDEDVALHTALLAKLAARNGLARLSVGMSGDYETAIRFGATHVRVGTAIFGAREAHARPEPRDPRRPAGGWRPCLCRLLSLGTCGPRRGSVCSVAMPTGGTMLKACLIGCSLSLLVAGSALAAGDAANGEKVFKRCAACHVIDDKTNRVGPHLRRRDRPHGRLGRGLQVFRIDDPARQGRAGLERGDHRRLSRRPERVHPEEQDGVSRA